jgi:hypothetical protein
MNIATSVEIKELWDLKGKKIGQNLPALGRLRQEECELEVSISYIARLHLKTGHNFIQIN